MANALQNSSYWPYVLNLAGYFLKGKMDYMYVNKHT